MTDMACKMISIALGNMPHIAKLNYKLILLQVGKTVMHDATWQAVEKTKKHSHAIVFKSKCNFISFYANQLKEN